MVILCASKFYKIQNYKFFVFLEGSEASSVMLREKHRLRSVSNKDEIIRRLNILHNEGLQSLYCLRCILRRNQ
jgi:hypothetical protein